MSDFPITREQFAAWLNSKADDEVVGVSWNSDRCPVAYACRDITQTDTTV